MFVAADTSAAMQDVVKNANYGVHLGLVIAAIVNVVNVMKDAAMFLWRKLDRGDHATVYAAFIPTLSNPTYFFSISEDQFKMTFTSVAATSACGGLIQTKCCPSGRSW